jgi:predicted P-loop ATPase
MRQLTFSLNEHIIGKGDHHLSGSGWKQTTSTVDEFLLHTAHSGEAIMPGLLNRSGKANDHITGFESLIIDVDNADPDTTTSWVEAMGNPFLKANACAMWTSPNHQLNDGSSKYRGQDRFRVLFVLPERIKICPAGNTAGLKEVNQLIARLNALIPGADPAVKAGHYLAGTLGAQLHIFGDNVLDLGQVPELPERVARVNVGTTSFSGTAQDSIANIKRWLPFIDPNDQSLWLAVCGCLKNASDLIGDEVALELFLGWSSGYHSYDEQENLNLWHRLEVGVGGFGRLKELAIDGGFEATAVTEPIDVATLFTQTDGYKVGDCLPKFEPSITTSQVLRDGQPVEVCWMTDLSGKQHDLTYALNKTLMNKHLIKAVDVVARDSHFRFDVANQLVIRDGDRIPDKQLKTINLVLSDEYGINFPEATKGAIEAIAMRDCFDPYVDELLEIEQRVTPIDISNLATRYFKATSPLADVMMEKWLVGLVGRLLNPGLPLRGVLVLVGAQHIGKDGFLNVLTQQRVKSVGRDTKLKDRDFLIAANSCWVVNLAEIENITRSQATGELKSWITESKDIITLKWENQATNFPRRFSLYGSCNNAKFLQDPSGNTRYWVIESSLTRENRVDLDLLEQEREAILAGAIALYRKYQRKEYQIELDDKQSRISEAHNAAYVEDAAFVHDLQTKLEGRTCTTKAEVLEMLDIDQAGQKANRTITNQVDLSLEQLGFRCIGSRKLREPGKPDASVKVLARCEEFDLSELRIYLTKPGQKWAQWDF